MVSKHLAVVPCSFVLGEAVPVKVEPQGNAKRSDRPNFHTQHSTLEDIKEIVNVMTPKAAMKQADKTEDAKP